MKPGSQASFDVTLKNFGCQYADVSINVRSLPDALTIVSGDEERLLDIGKSVTYHITISASDNIAPGTHKFEIADKSQVDQHTWAPISVRVTGGMLTPPADATIGQTEAKKSPGFGVVAMMFALLLAYRAGRVR